MSLGLIFWIIMLLWLLGALYWNWPGNAPPTYWLFGNSMLLFILFLLVGWQIFGAPIHR